MSELSPAERYAVSRVAASHPVVEDFRVSRDFDLDPFQIEACQRVEEGQSVLVAAPTGAGKTIVAEFAIHLAMSDPAQASKVFFTTPMTALSNQKYNELVDRWGSDDVGLLTGDTNINGNARLVVMTTEVLRNMLYADSAALNDLTFVIMDEVHYLADRFRGAVWEEVIIHLPEAVRLICLSATGSSPPH
jgi:ATP-dependent RNA helicase HelY